MNESAESFANAVELVARRLDDGPTRTQLLQLVGNYRRRAVEPTELRALHSNRVIANAISLLESACEHEDWPGWKLIPPEGRPHCPKHCLLRCNACKFGLEPLSETKSPLALLVADVEELKHRVEWLRGIALERAGVAQDVDLVRGRLAKLWVAEDGPAVRAAFDRLMTRLTEGE